MGISLASRSSPSAICWFVLKPVVLVGRDCEGGYCGRGYCIGLFKPLTMLSSSNNPLLSLSMPSLVLFLPAKLLW
ncbi:hypothetical protein F4859DRAFT_468144 [Xylaria cf. heliscus]|nr:hypothetical protein F4859DRAFT_468144 [Xylaria cf. heliscus]